MKKLISVVLIATLLATTGVGVAMDIDEWIVAAPTESLIFLRDRLNNEIAKRESADQGETPDPTAAPKSDVLMEHDFGTVHVALIGYHLETIYDTPCLVLKYRWHHTEKTAQIFSIAISNTAYQNGVQLVPYPYINASDNVTMNVLANTEVTTYSAFVLRDMQSKVLIEVTKTFDFNEKHGKMAFNIPLS